MGWRGRCEASIASMIGRSHKDNTLERRLMQDRRCPPPIWRGEAPERRLAATRRSGTAAWRAQAPGSDNAPRARIAGTVGGDGPSIAAVSNPGCSSELLEVLSLDGHFYVRRSVAQHPVCPTTALQRFAADDNTDVSSEARTRLAERRLGAGAAPPQTRELMCPTRWWMMLDDAAQSVSRGRPGVSAKQRLLGRGNAGDVLWH